MLRFQASIKGVRRVIALLCLALGWVSGGVSAAPDLPSWLSGEDTRMHRVEAEMLETHAYVYESGEREGPSVLLVHGLGTEGARVWRRLMPALAADAHVIAVDLPGFGRSGKPNVLYSPAAYTAFLDQVIERFATDEPVSMVGHSMGASVALYYAHRQPERVGRLVLAAPAGILHGAAYASFLSRLGVEQLLPQIPGIGNSAAKLVDRLTAKLERFGPDPARALETAHSRERYLDADPNRIAGLALVATDYSRILRETKVPAVILWGGEDQIAPVRVGYLLTALMPQARLEIIEDGSHMFVLEQAEAFQRTVSAILTRSTQALRAYAQDQYPRPFEGIDTDRSAECRGEGGRVYTGSYRRLKIYDCNNVTIQDADIGRLEIISSDVRMRNSHVVSSDVAVVLRNSTVEITAGRIRGSVAFDATGARVDAAGVRIVADKAAVRAPQPSVFTFSVARVESPHTDGYLHDVYTVRPGADL